MKLSAFQCMGTNGKVLNFVKATRESIQKSQVCQNQNKVKTKRCLLILQDARRRGSRNVQTRSSAGTVSATSPPQSLGLRNKVWRTCPPPLVGENDPLEKLENPHSQIEMLSPPPKKHEHMPASLPCQTTKCDSLTGHCTIRVPCHCHANWSTHRDYGAFFLLFFGEATFNSLCSPMVISKHSPVVKKEWPPRVGASSSKTIPSAKFALPVYQVNQTEP